MKMTLTPVRFLERAAKIYGKNSAIVCENDRFTYSQYAYRVNQLANALRNLDVKPADRVAYFGYNCHRLLECYYGIPALGAVLLPLNIRLAPTDIQYIIQDAEPKVLFVDPDFLTKIESILMHIPSVKHFFLLNDLSQKPPWISGEYESLIQESTSTDILDSGMPYPFDEDDMAELFYTSGTTGRPKGVMLTHRNLYLHALAALANFPVFETTKQLHLIPLFHVNGWGTPHYLTAKGGLHVVVKKFDPNKVLKLIEKEKVTRFYAIPTMIKAILEHPELSSFNLDNLEDIQIGGSPPPSGMCTAAEDALGCTVHGGFGMTETSPLITLPELPKTLDPDVFRHRAHETWGFPVIGAEIKVIDEEGRTLPWNGEAIGELLVRGDMVMEGYFNDSAATESALKGGWYHTGDLASIGSDGSLYIRDRIKDIIISGGENISSLEIEQVLYSHPEVLTCAVIGKEDPHWGEIPKAIVVLRPDSQLSSKEIIDFTRDRLAHFKALKEVEIIDEMPLGGTGKILKSELRKKYGGRDT